MKSKSLASIGLILIIHLFPVLQGCPGCGDPEYIDIDYTGVEVAAFNYEYNIQDGSVFSIDRNQFKISVKLTVPEEFEWWVWKPTFISQAYAWDCDNTFININQWITDVDILELPDNTQAEQIDRKNDFLADHLSNGLYTEIDQFLKDRKTQLNLAARYIPEVESAEFLIKTQVSDGTVHSDTIKVIFQ